MPLCLGASGSVRARQIAQSACRACDVQTFCPSSSHPPAILTARVRSDARSDPAPGSENSWHQMISPRRVGPTKVVPLLVGAVGQDGGQRPVADGGRGLGQARPRELLGDHHLGGRARADAVRPRVVRRRQPAFGQEPALAGRRQRRRLGQRLRRPGPQPLRLVVQPHLVAALGGRREPGQPPLPAARRAEQRGQAHRATPVQVDVVLPGVADAAEQRDRLQGEVDGGGGGDHRRRPPPPARTARRPGRARRRRPRPPR